MIKTNAIDHAVTGLIISCSPTMAQGAYSTGPEHNVVWNNLPATIYIYIHIIFINHFIFYYYMWQTFSFYRKCYRLFETQHRAAREFQLITEFKPFKSVFIMDPLSSTFYNADAHSLVYCNICCFLEGWAEWKTTLCLRSICSVTLFITLMFITG